MIWEIRREALIGAGASGSSLVCAGAAGLFQSRGNGRQNDLKTEVLAGWRCPGFIARHRRGYGTSFDYTAPRHNVQRDRGVGFRWYPTRWTVCPRSLGVRKMIDSTLVSPRQGPGWGSATIGWISLGGGFSLWPQRVYLSASVGKPGEEACRASCLEIRTSSRH
jgi:hypothetical protein